VTTGPVKDWALSVEKLWKVDERPDVRQLRG